jgi:hypothetical protein
MGKSLRMVDKKGDKRMGTDKKQKSGKGKAMKWTL